MIIVNKIILKTTFNVDYTHQFSIVIQFGLTTALSASTNIKNVVFKNNAVCTMH